MSEETIIVEVEPDSIKPQSFDVNISDHLKILVEETKFSVKDEETKPKDLNGSLFVAEKTFGSNEIEGHGGSRSKVNVSSRYLGGSSSGSCHDLCKYGHRKTSKNVSEGKNLTKTTCSADHRKKSVVRRLSFPAAKAENQIQTHGKEVEQCGRGIVEPREKLTAVESLTKRSSRDKTLKEQSKSRQRLLKSSSHMIREVKVVQCEDKALGVASEATLSKPPVKKAMSMNGRINRDLSRLSHLKNHQSNGQQELKAQSPEDMPEKIIHMTEPNGKSTPAETSQRVSSDSKRLLNTRAQSQTDNKARFSIPKTTLCSTKSKPEAFKVKQRNAKQNGTIVDLGEEQIGETESVRSRRGDTRSLDSKLKSYIPKVKPSTPKTKPETPKAKQIVETNGKVVKKGKGQHGDEGSISIWKMKFRRGRVIVLPTATNSPKKLKFRRPGGLRDSQQARINPSKLDRKIKEIEGEEQQKDVDGLAKVVLRRQEATLKKGDIDLNNVIEETASKLVKTRKSKVKALVGAFETVMSLQDRRALEETIVS